MEQNSEQLVKDRLAELPADVRDAIQSSDLDVKVQTIGTKNSLHVDQIGELSDEVMLTMLGFLPLESFASRLSQVLNVAPAVGDTLAADINTEIFGPIRESMKNWAQKKNAPAPIEETRPAAAIPVAAPKLPINPELQKVDVMLSEKTLSPTVAPANPIYKADPYREPI
jgi:hypothetical protein